jgi:uncharacterized protein (DUF1015 family)
MMHAEEAGLTPLIQPFAAIRPIPERAVDVVARPYDVLSFAEAKAEAAGRPLSFLHVSRAEIDLPDATDAHAPEVYAQAARAFAAMRRAAVLIADERPGFYVYRLSAAEGHEQTGLAVAASVAAYRQNRVRKHEHTRPDKVLDRARQIEAVGAHTGPVLAVHQPNRRIALLMAETANGTPVADATTDDGTRHRVWPMRDEADITEITRLFEAMPALWIADGHHRSAAAARLAERRQAAGLPCNGRFLQVTFPTDEVRILDYNRVVRDLLHPADAFLHALDKICLIEEVGTAVHPEAKGTFGMYLAGRWYRLRLRHQPDATGSPAASLDASLLQERILGPLLGISDPRSDARIDFIGGGRGLGALEERVRSGQWAVAFSLYPTHLEDVIAVADAGEVMPPKSTWFEPKLADGLLSLPLA